MALCLNVLGMQAQGPDPFHPMLQEGKLWKIVDGYWMTSAPKEEDYSETDISKARGLWALQQMARRNAAKYTNLLKDDKSVVAIKFIDEVLKNPDGEMLFPGELHGRPEIPAPGLRYAMQDPKLYKKDLQGFNVIVCDEYLQSRKVLKVTDDFNKPMPKDIVQKMEKKYGMKAQRSLRSCTIEGGYTFGVPLLPGRVPAGQLQPGLSVRAAEGIRHPQGRLGQRRRDKRLYPGGEACLLHHGGAGHSEGLCRLEDL